MREEQQSWLYANVITWSFCLPFFYFCAWQRFDYTFGVLTIFHPNGTHKFQSSKIGWVLNIVHYAHLTFFIHPLLTYLMYLVLFLISAYGIEKFMKNPDVFLLIFCTFVLSTSAERISTEYSYWNIVPICLRLYLIQQIMLYLTINN